MKHNQFNESITAFQHSVELKLESERFANLGNVMSKQGKVDEAIEAFHRAIELDPQFSHGYVGLGFNFLVRRQYVEADAAFERAIALNPDLASAFEGFGRSLTEQEKFGRAITCLYKAIELNPSSSVSYFHLGSSLLRQYRFNEAVVVLQQAAELNSQSLQIQKKLEIALQLSEAITEIPSIEIISVHIPKTAGSTFGHCFLQNVYSNDQIFYDYDSLEFEETLLRIDPHVKVIHGHFHASKYKSFIPSAKLVTWLRHPFDRLISWYFFWLMFPKSEDIRHKYVLENNLNFREFINLPFTFNNCSDYYLHGIKLNEFDFVGLQEFFEEDLNEFKKTIGHEKALNPTRMANVNTYPDYNSLKKRIMNDPELIELMSKNNSKDLKLYQFALELRNHRRNR